MMEPNQVSHVSIAHYDDYPLLTCQKCKITFILMYYGEFSSKQVGFYYCPYCGVEQKKKRKKGGK